jgi:signal transduction histidine kinase
MAATQDDLVRALALVSHELRTPLSVVSGYLNMLASERAGPLSESQKRSVAGATRACDQLIALAADIGHLARLERNELPFNRAEVKASALIADALAALRTAEGHTVTIESSGNDDGTVLVDPVRMKQALRLLLAAVARTVPDGATVRVSRVMHIENGRHWLVLAIAQAGQADTLSIIDHGHLEPFDEWEGGLGVGLLLARRVVQLEGGRIRSLETPSLGLVVMLPALMPGTRTA